jgi:putative endonuclease
VISAKRQKGNEAEEIAAEYLKKRGYKILARNYSSKTGEVDIIARLKNTLVFVEVKARASDAFGGAAAAVTKAKQLRVTKAAISYIKQNRPAFDALMFDIIALTGGRVEHIQNAFVVQGYTI